MNLREFLDTAIRLEQAVAGCHQSLAEIVPDPESGEELRRMAHEETQHVSALRLGRDYVSKMPDLFGRQIVPCEALQEGLDGAEALLKDILTGHGWRAHLLQLRELERKFESVHIDTSVEVRDPSLQRLFENLCREDRAHIEVLDGILSRLKPPLPGPTPL
jgi:rubrerythrin